MIACVFLPYFAAALEGCAPPLDMPLVVLQYHGQRGKVIACSQSAQTLGVTRGISVSRARALCPQAVQRRSALHQLTVSVHLERGTAFIIVEGIIERQGLVTNVVAREIRPMIRVG